MKDEFGLDKDARLAAEREEKARRERVEARLKPPFPYNVNPPKLLFLGR